MYYIIPASRVRRESALRQCEQCEPGSVTIPRRGWKVGTAPRWVESSWEEQAGLGPRTVVHQPLAFNHRSSISCK